MTVHHPVPLHDAAAQAQAAGLADAVAAPPPPAKLLPAERAARLADAAAAQRAGSPDAAEGLYRDLLAADADDDEALLGLGHCARQRGDAAAALHYFEAAAAVSPGKPWPLIQCGEALRQLGRRDEAVAAYSRASDGPARVQALLGLGHTAREAADDTAALAHFQAAAAADTGNPWPHIYAGDTLRRLGRVADAEAAYRRAGTDGPVRLHTLLGLGHCAELRADHPAALAAFTAATQSDPADPWPHFYVGQALRHLARPAEVEAAYRRALEANPRHYGATVALGQLARGRGDRDAAATLFARATEIDPAPSAAWLELAAVWRDRGEIARAHALSAELAARDPQDAAAGIALALAQRQAGTPEAAYATLSALVAVRPAHVEARIELARLELDLGRPQRAAALLAQVIADAPTSCRALEQLAELARIARDFPAALALLRRAVLAQPANPWPRIGLAQTLADLGQLADALTTLDEAAAALAPQDAHRAAVAGKRIELLRRAGHWPAALDLARRTRAAWPQHETAWVQAFLIELPAGGADGIAACLDTAPATAAPARLAQFRGHAAEAAWQLDAAAAHYAAALALAPDDAWIHTDMTRVQMLRLDLAAARAHLRELARLTAGIARLQRRSPNVSQTHYGQILDEYELEPEGFASLAALRARPPGARIAPSLALLRRLPGFTPAAVALLVALRQDGQLAAGGAGASPIPRRIAQFWDTVPPPDIAAILGSWAAQHPTHSTHLFDDAAARAFLAERFAPDVLAAYARAREPARRADLFRLAYLYAEGGWYVDADDRCLAPLTTLPAGGAALVLYQEDLGTLGNNFIGAVPQHAVLGRALDEAVAALLRGDEDVVWLSTGPGLLTRAFAAVLAESRLGWPGWLAHAAVLDRATVFGAVAMHCFTGYKGGGRHWSDPSRRLELPVSGQNEERHAVQGIFGERRTATDHRLGVRP